MLHPLDGLAAEQALGNVESGRGALRAPSPKRERIGKQRLQRRSARPIQLSPMRR